MTLIPHSLTHSDSSAPLHSLLLSFGKGLLQREQTAKAMNTLSPEMLTAAELLQHTDAASLEQRVRELTVKQLSTMLRMQAPEAEDVTMLNSLETLVLAGEIGYAEFIERVQHLFPREMGALETTMRMKIAALVL